MPTSSRFGNQKFVRVDVGIAPYNLNTACFNKNEGARGNITILFLSPTKNFRTKMRRLFYLHKKAYQTYAQTAEKLKFLIKSHKIKNFFKKSIAISLQMG